MYTIRIEQHFDAAHFLTDYDGKCSNLHGHRWRVLAEVAADALSEEGPARGMVADFGDLKRDLKERSDRYDHTLIYERGTLRETTVRALQDDEGFSLTEVAFRPTAECLAKDFYDWLVGKGYPVQSVAVYETPDNCATYRAEG